MKGCNKLSYNSRKVASEIVDIFAKYNVPICCRENIYKLTDELIFEQKIVELDDDLRLFVCSEN